MKDAHVTLYDVAARAGVSASTASRALAGLKVSKANHAAVEKAAADLGYIPNEAARALRVVRTMTVGMVFNQLTSQLGMELLGSLTEALDARGYGLFISTAQGDPARYDRLVYRFLERRVDALLCVHGHGEAAALKRFLGAGVPALALISKAGDYGALPLISTGVRGAAADCVARLRELGHRRIGVIRPPMPVNLIDDFLAVAGPDAHAINPPRLADGRLDAAAFARALAAAPSRPTAIIGLLGDAAALAEAAPQAGLSVPKDLSVVAIRDRSVLAGAVRQSMSIIHIEPSLMGPKVAEILARWLDGQGGLQADQPVETGSWIERATTGPAPQV